MAKGLRSKTMRKNRSALRVNLVDGINRKHLEKSCAVLAESIKERSGNSIDHLKALLHSSKGPVAIKAAEKEEFVEPSANQAKLKDRIAFLKAKKKSGSKAKDNVGKVLTWF